MHLNDWMKRHGISKNKLARLLGASAPQVVRWTLGRVRPSLPWAMAIEKLTSGHVPLTSWLSEDELLTLGHVGRRPLPSTKRVTRDSGRD